MTEVPDVALALPGAMVLLGPVGTRGALHAVIAAEAEARRNGTTLPAPVVRLREVLAAALAGTAGTGRSAVPREAAVQPSDPSTVLDPIGVQEAAEMLGCKGRNVRDLCSRGVFATAHRRSGVWVLSRREAAVRAARVAVGPAPRPSPSTKERA